MSLYTKNGLPLQRSGDIVYSRSGKVVGKIIGDIVYGPDGRYVGTIVSGRLVFRSGHNADRVARFTAAPRAASGMAHTGPSGVSGSEPTIPD